MVCVGNTVDLVGGIVKMGCLVGGRVGRLVIFWVGGFGGLGSVGVGNVGVGSKGVGGAWAGAAGGSGVWGV